jgi:hypothetical protein
MNALRSFFALGIFIAFIVSSCSISREKSDLSGNLVTQERTISDFSELEVRGIFNLYLSQGDRVELQIVADEQTHEDISVISKGEKLILDFKKNEKVFGNQEINVYLTVKDLSSFEFDGVGVVKTEMPLKLNHLKLVGNGVGNTNLELIVKKLDAEFNMVGNITLRGKAETVLLQNDGVGNLDASELITDFMTLESEGIGKVEVYCEKELSITVNGIGKVTYSGDAEIKKLERNGIGKVEKK